MMGSTDHEAPRCEKNFHTKFYDKKKLFHCRPERESLIRKSLKLGHGQFLIRYDSLSSYGLSVVGTTLVK